MLFFFSFNFARPENNKNDCPEHFFPDDANIFRGLFYAAFSFHRCLFFHLDYSIPVSAIKKCAPKYAFCYLIILEGGLYVVIRTLLAHAHFAANRADDGADDAGNEPAEAEFR